MSRDALLATIAGTRPAPVAATARAHASRARATPT